MATDFNAMRVLIVEDQAEMRAVLRNMLGELGVNQIFEAENGGEGASFMNAAGDLVDMVLCDWNMPEMSGIDFLKKMRKEGSLMPFLMISGRDDIGSILKAKECGVSGYIKKPFSHTQLETKLRILIERSKTQMFSDY